MKKSGIPALARLKKRNWIMDILRRKKDIARLQNMEGLLSMKKNHCKKNDVAGYAPIVVFAYNRADMLERLLQTLEANPDTETMDLFIFVDVPDKKNKKDLKYNSEVIQFVDIYKNSNKKFKSVTVEVAEQHKGLADSIISGVSKIIDAYGKVIVLEDDLEVSNDFLDYMQRGLDFYKNDKRVHAVTGYCPKMKVSPFYKKDIFLSLRASSWGWGTWRNRWNRVDWEVKYYDKFRRDIVGQMLFSIGGSDLCGMLKHQMEDKNFNSWAIRFCYQMFRERKYTIFPVETRVIHCGIDKRSVHVKGGDISGKLKQSYKKCRFEPVSPSIRMIWRFRKSIEARK